MCEDDTCVPVLAKSRSPVPHATLPHSLSQAFEKLEARDNAGDNAGSVACGRVPGPEGGDARPNSILECIMETMAGLQCVCGDVFAASCDVEPAGCAFAWLLLLLSAVAHAMRYCTTDECDSSDDDEPSTMYS